MGRTEYASATLIAVLALSAAPARAGWTQPAGSSYFKVWDQVLIGSRAFDLDGQIVDLGQSYQDHALKLYFEYGLDDDLTAVVRATPLGIASFGEETTAYAGMIELGMRVALLRGQVPVALELRYGYAPPLGGTPVAEGMAEGRAFRYQPALERHAGSADLSAGWAWSWTWVQASVGTTFLAGDGLDPVFQASIRGGLSTEVGISGDVGLTAHLPFRQPQILDITGTGNTRYVGLNLGVGYAITDRFGVRLDLGLAPHAVSNAATPSVGVGVELRTASE